LPTSTISAASAKKNAKAKKITGYQLVLPEDVAAAIGIQLGRKLPTYVALFNTESDKVRNIPAKYLSLEKGSFATATKEKSVALSVSLKEMPTQPFTLLVTSVNEPIDGALFVANAKAFQGKFPGPRTGLRRVMEVAMLGGNFYFLTAAFGPIAGPAAAGGVFLGRTIIAHHAAASQKKAEAKLLDAVNQQAAHNANATPTTEGKAPSEEMRQ